MSGGDYDATYGVKYNIADGVGICWVRVYSGEDCRPQYGCTNVKYDLTDEVEDGRLESAWGQLGQETQSAFHMNTVCNRQLGPYRHQQVKNWSIFGPDRKLKEKNLPKKWTLFNMSNKDVT